MSRKQTISRTINIGGDPADVNYRYKMQPLRTKIQGRGNGVKTVLTNVVEVSKDLRTSPEYVTKYFGIELGASNKFDKKREVGIVNGRHQARDLQESLQKFVDEFILCPQRACRLPELEIRVRNERIEIRCASCNHTGVLQTRHKLRNFIIHRPPTTNRAPPQEREETKEGDERIGKINQASAIVLNDDSWSSSPMEEVVALQRFDSMIWVLKSRKRNDTKSRRGGEGNSSPTAKRGLLQNLRLCMRNGCGVDEIFSEIERMVQAHEFSPTKKMKIVFDAVFDLDDDSVDKFIPTIRERAELLERFTRTEKEFFLFVGCLEEVLTIRQPRLANEVMVSRIFLTLYECQVLDEEQLIEWYMSPTDSSWIVTKQDAQVVRKLVAPFMEWLIQAEVVEGVGGEEEHVGDIIETPFCGIGRLPTLAEEPEIENGDCKENG